MKYFLLHKNGIIMVVSTLEESENEESLRNMEYDNPGYSAVFLSKEEYDQVNGFGEYFTYSDNKLKSKSKEEKDKIDAQKDLFYNEQAGLSSKISKLEAEIEALKQKIK
jgi:hypothetical protein